ncbi:hypothetical protein [Erwinia amylovora]|uniref:hypothetical protein n=1 Tax=Erwinia amylovora TaxID=552 RepID=UPI0001CCB7EA|nr:hypothetical protein [Erwinia amylovora]CBJ48213.1 conserved hypothetical protein [Erwinia amylovora ATCC 49946]
MRNRARTIKRDEADFINSGTANVNGQNTAPQSVNKSAPKIKARPVSISFANENLLSIDEHIKSEVLAGNSRVNRSDIVRAAIMALDNLPREDIARLIQRAKMQ